MLISMFRFVVFVAASFATCSAGLADIIAVQDFDGGSPTWSFVADPVAGSFTSSTQTWDIVTSVGTGGDSLTMTNNFWGVRDIVNNSIPGGTAGTLTFADISVAGQTDISVTFDYSVFGWDTGDDLSYQVVLDGVAQTSVLLVDGLNGSGGIDASGTETINIINGTSTVGLIITMQQIGGGDWGGIDNVTLNATSVPEPASLSLLSLVGAGFLFRRRRSA